MEPRTCVLLYSNYSRKSAELLTSLKNCPVNLEAIVGLTFLSVDNEKIRKQILKSKNIQINSVPSLLILYNTGDVEKFEGSKVFEWIDDVVRHNLPPQPPPPQPPPPPPPMQQPPLSVIDGEEPFVQYPQEQVPQQQQVPPQQYPQQQVPQQQYPQQKVPQEERRGVESQPVRRRKKKVHVEEYSDGEEETYEPVKPRVKSKQKFNQERLSKIENLDSDESDPEYVKRPPAGVRNGAGGYELTEDFGKLEEVNRDMSSKMKSPSENGTQGSNLMAMAQQMQKEREM